MNAFKRVVAYSVFAIQILIAFILLFQGQIEVPSWLQAFGRLHPLLLHLPIGLLLVTTILYFTRQFFANPSFDELISFLLHITAFTASFSVFMGLLLSMEGGYDGNTLAVHKWLGVALSFYCWILLSSKPDPKILKPVLVLGSVLVIFTGHYGANLTHGENFVFGPLQQDEIRIRELTDSTTLFAATIEPILESKCYGCHNEKKAKGKLILTSLEAIAKGGEDGVLWKAGDLEHSLLLERLNLPLESKEHMPPKDKAQLTADELAFISYWVLSGADIRTKYTDVGEKDTLKKLSSAIVARYHQPSSSHQQYNFEFVSQQKIRELSTPSRTVFQISLNEPALQADFYLSSLFQKKHLEELGQVRKQLVAIDLSKMPVDDADIKTIAQFTNLERLILNNTHVSGETLDELAKLEHLESLSLSGTQVNVQSLRKLSKNNNLKEVYLWNTGIGPAEVKRLQEEIGSIRWEAGYVPDETERLRLSPPFLKNDGQVLKADEPIMLKHNLPGVVIRYEQYGEALDSIQSAVYEMPIAIDRYALIKAKAFKEGWVSSRQAEFVFFKKGATPDKAEIVTNPDKKYPGEGGTTLIDDKKGMPDFYRDPVWMGFREEPLEAYFTFEKEIPEVKTVTLSYAKNIYAMCMPPATLEVWGGADKSNLKLLKKIIPVQPDSYVGTRIEGATVEIPPSKFACYKIVAKPLSKLPAFRKEKKEKGWLMVDEVFFN
jgi:uncharacterized membrane protein